MLNFQVGSRYSRSEIHGVFGGQRRSGICTPRNHAVVILFTSVEGSKFGYQDGWKEDGFFHYTGEGQLNDMQMIKGNLAILEHAKNGKSLMLFQKVEKDQYRFVDYMKYVGHYEQTIPDAKSTLRRGLIFKLRPTDGALAEDEWTTKPESLSLETLRKRAVEASRERVDKTTRMSTYWERSQAVAAYVLVRARGFCEACGFPAPFLRRDGTTPYLEIHHTQQVSDDGPDTPTSVMALCPTCHRRVHHGQDGKQYNRLIAGIPLIVEESCESGRLKVVTAAVISDSEGKVLVCQRANGPLAGYWEFPGGKILDNEKPEACIRREIQEELRIVLGDVVPLMMVDHDYGEFAIRLLCFACTASGTPVLTEHRAGRWVPPEQLGRMNLAPADAAVARPLQMGKRIADLPMVADKGKARYLP